MIKILHAADLHLDAPFSGLPAQQAAARRGEQRGLLGRLAELARDEGAELALLAGDLLDGAHAYYETADALARALAQMECPVFIAPGNHDPFTDRSPWAAFAWPENVHIFRTQSVQAVELPELDCVVYGAAFTGPLRETGPLEGLRVSDGSRVHIGCFHGEVGVKNSRYGPIAEEEIAASGLDYLALGHIHAAGGIRLAGGTYYAWPGCPEGRGFDETGEKGVLCGTVARGRTDLRFVPTARRRYEVLHVDVGAADAQEALRAALPPDAREDIYRIILTGESGAVDLGALRALAEPYFYSVSLRDHTVLRRDVWARAGEDTLTGLFLRQMRARLDGAADARERALVTDAVRFGLAALEGGEDRP